MSDATETNEAVQVEVEDTRPEPEPRQCVCCQKFNGGAVVIKRGRVGRDSAGRYVPDWFCQSCLDLEAKGTVRRDKRTVFRARLLFEELARRNREREEWLAEAEAETEKFEQAKAYWQALALGTPEQLPEVRKDQGGMLVCGVVGCYKCHDKADLRAEYYAVVKIGGKHEVLGLCPAQFAALKKSEAAEKILASKFFNAMRAEAERRDRKVENFEEAKVYWAKVALGTAEQLPEVRKDERGNLLCGVPDCGCRKHNQPVEHYAVMETALALIGLCRWQFAATRQSEARIFSAGGPEGLDRCERHLAWHKRQAERAARADNSNGNGNGTGNGQKPIRYDKPGMGLSRFVSPEKREERKTMLLSLEKRENDRRERQLERAQATNPKAGRGKKANSRGKKKGGGQKGGRK